VGVSRNIVQGGDVKNMATHKKDDETYKRHLSTFKKTFPTFIYHSPSSS
jgi:hypothetical protein